MAARRAAVGWRDLVRQSRVATWPWTAVPYLVGAFDAERGIGPALVIGTIYFLGPFNLLWHGMDSMLDDAGRPTEAALSIGLAIAVTNLPFLVLLAYLGGLPGALALVLTVGVASVPALPMRGVRRPFEGESLLSATVVVLAGVCGLLIAGRGFASLPWGVLVAAWLWAAATLGFAGMARRGVDGGERLGPRVVSALVLAAYALSVTLLARQGVLGLLAALGVALYAIPPVMVLAADRTMRDAHAAARRAVGERTRLDLLVGAWLAVLLLRHWGVMDYSPWQALVVLSTAATAWVLWSILATRFTTRRRHVAEAVAAVVPSVTIVVPCLDDADRLPACLAGIRAQTYADTTVLVVDAGSTDGTVEEAAAWFGDDAVLVTPPRPAGWGARDWARHVGAMAATTDLVLFVDADTVIVPIATRILVEQQQAGGADLLTGLTRWETNTAGERAADPGFPLVLFGFVPIWLSALTAGRPAAFAFAAAPLMLVRRDAYLESVASVASAPGDAERTPSPGGRFDIGLARSLAKAGRTVRTVHAADLGATRHHQDLPEAIAGWRRVIPPSTQGGVALAIATMGLEVLAFVLPLALPAAALLTDQPPALVVTSAIPLGLLLVARVALIVTQRQAPATLLWHPVTVLLTLIGQAAGLVVHLDRPVDEAGLTPSSG